MTLLEKSKNKKVYRKNNAIIGLNKQRLQHQFCV